MNQLSRRLLLLLQLRFSSRKKIKIAIAEPNRWCVSPSLTDRPSAIRDRANNFRAIPIASIRLLLQALLALALFLVCARSSLIAGEPEKSYFAIPAGDAASTLEIFSDKIKMQIVYLVDEVRGIKTNATHGEFTVREALDRMLAGTSLRVAVHTGTGAFAITRISPPIATKATIAKTNPMHKHRSLVGMLLALFFTVGSTNAPAQTQDQTQAGDDQMPAASSNQSSPNNEEEAVQMSPYVVQQKSGQDTGYASQQTLLGTRTAEDVANISGIVDIINQQMIEDLNPLTFKDVVDYGSAGVTQATNFNDATEIRGFYSPSLRDGIILNGGQDPYPLYDVESVEVIKGPASLITGSNAFIGGALNYVPFRPTPYPTGSLTFTSVVDELGQTYNRFVVNAMGPGYKSGDFSVDYRFTAGGVYGSADDKAIDKRDEQFYGGALLINFNKNTSLDINVYYYKCDDYIYYDDFLNYNDYLNNFAVLSPYSIGFTPGSQANAWEYENDADFDMTLTTRLTDHSTLRVFDSYFYTTSDESLVRTVFFSPDGFTLSRQWIPFYEQASQNETQVDYLHRLSFKDVKNDFTAGGDYTVAYEIESYFVGSLPSVDSRIQNPNYSADGPAIAAYEANATQYGSNIFIGPNGGSEITRAYNLSYYVQDNLSFLNDRIIVVGGLRWYYDRQLTEDLNYQYDGSGVYATPTDETPLQVHKFGIVVKPISWLSLYWADMTNELYQGGFYYPATGPAVPLPNNVGEDIEFGAKVNYKPSDQIQIFGSIDRFNEEETNIDTALPTLTASGQQISEPLSNTSTGMEAELGVHYNFVNSGYLDSFATFYRADTLAAQYPEDVQANGAPNNVWSILIKYTITNGWLKGLMIGGGAYGQGYRWQGNLKIPTPTTFNALARYQLNKHWAFQLNADNLTNKRYVIQIATPGLVQGSVPGTLSLAVNYKWGH